jgi:hypothetical protein
MISGRGGGHLPDASTEESMAARFRRAPKLSKPFDFSPAIDH